MKHAFLLILFFTLLPDLLLGQSLTRIGFEGVLHKRDTTFEQGINIRAGLGVNKVAINLQANFTSTTDISGGRGIDVESQVGWYSQGLGIMARFGIDDRGVMWFGGRLEYNIKLLQVGRDSYLMMPIHIASAVFTPKEESVGLLHSAGIGLNWVFYKDW